uniref:M6 n=1 Tax=Pararge aegeria TaxID=116150 RepID=S4PB54_9NEOP
MGVVYISFSVAPASPETCSRVIYHPKLIINLNQNLQVVEVCWCHLKLSIRLIIINFRCMTLRSVYERFTYVIWKLVSNCQPVKSYRRAYLWRHTN